MAAREPGKQEPASPAGRPQPQAAGRRAEQAAPTGSGAPAGAGAPAETSPLSAGSRNRLGWIAIAVAGALTAWQVVYALTAPTTPSPETYESVSLLVTLVLAVGGIVLGVVALGQRATPRWPAITATAVGAFAFVVCVATWVGSLMA